MAAKRSALVWVTVAVVVHLVVSVLHGQAHKRLGVGLSSWQLVYVYAVIFFGPLIALAVSFTRYTTTGLWLLLLTMLGSLVFGFCYHYVVISPDHVAHLPPGEARHTFRVTALLLLITETLGIVIATIALRTRHKAN